MFSCCVTAFLLSYVSYEVMKDRKVSSMRSRMCVCVCVYEYFNIKFMGAHKTWWFLDQKEARHENVWKIWEKSMINGFIRNNFTPCWERNELQMAPLTSYVMFLHQIGPENDFLVLSGETHSVRYLNEPQIDSLQLSQFQIILFPIRCTPAKTTSSKEFS